MSIESKFIREKSLATLSSFGIGGPASLFIEIKTIEEMLLLRLYINQNQLPCWMIGRGSNALFDDRGFDGLVILNAIRFCRFNKGAIEVGAGYNFSLLGSQLSRSGWSGLEFASGIPGSVGGAVFMNAGASGSETCDHLTEVSYVDQEGKLIHKKKSELTFSYRFSSFHENKGMIVSANFQLKKKDDAKKKQLAITKYRIATQPYGELSAGCIFKNPMGEKSAGALIERSGLKGRRVGGAEVSTLHANFIVNRGGAKATDVLELAKVIRTVVLKKTGVDLEMELRPIPYQLKGN